MLWVNLILKFCFLFQFSWGHEAIPKIAVAQRPVLKEICPSLKECRKYINVIRLTMNLVVTYLQKDKKFWSF